MSNLKLCIASLVGIADIVSLVLAWKPVLFFVVAFACVVVVVEATERFARWLQRS